MNVMGALRNLLFTAFLAGITPLSPAHAWESLGGMMGGSGGAAVQQESNRAAPGLAARPTFDLSASITPGQLGSFRLLAIGIDTYSHVPRLKNAAADARSVAGILKRDFGFETRLVENPDRDGMEKALRDFAASAGTSDNLVLYYAGHGILEGTDGFWLPRDAAADDDNSWIALSGITRMLKQSRARKVLVLSDSCYAGTLTRTVQDAPPDYAAILGQNLARRSRIALTSGGLEPVDDGRGGHSVFATALIEALNDAATGPLTGTALFSATEAGMGQVRQAPEYADIPAAGHDGGDFIFLKR